MIDIFNYFETFSPLRQSFRIDNPLLSLYYPLSIILIGYLIRKLKVSINGILVFILLLQVFNIAYGRNIASMYLVGYTGGLLILGWFLKDIVQNEK